MTLLPLTPDELLSTTRAVRKRLDLERPVPDGTGGTSGAAGSAGTSGTSGSGSSNPAAAPASGDSGGCSVPSGSRGSSGGVLVFAALAAAVSRRRRMA